MKPKERKLYFLGLIAILVTIYWTLSALFLNGESNTKNTHLQQRSYPISQELLQKIADGEKVRSRFLEKRKNLIGTRNIKDMNPWQNPHFWQFFPPTISCPFTIERLGFVGDGGKFVCGLEHIIEKSQKSSCIAYSFGVGPDSSLELELLERTNCNVYAYDPTVNDVNFNRSKYPGRIHFQKVGLGISSNNMDNSSKSLKYFMTENGHEWIDWLKIDIEGGEFEALSQVVEDFPDILPFAHLNLELHIQDFGRTSGNNARQYGDAFEKFWKWWDALENKGLRVYMSETNYIPCIEKRAWIPTVIEYSFINIGPYLNSTK